MTLEQWCAIFSAAGGIGAVVTPFILWRMQNNSADAQAKLAQKLTTESLLQQNEHAHKLESAALNRREARRLFTDINRHTQLYTYRFARAHPQEIPLTSPPVSHGGDNSFFISAAFCQAPDKAVSDARKAELVDMIAELNADVLMLGLMFGKEKSEPTGRLIQALVRTSRFILDSACAKELKELRAHNEENSNLVGEINRSVKPLWESLVENPTLDAAR